MLGWQGAIGASIQSVVHDINKFTKDRKELIFLDVNEINVINYGVTGPITDNAVTGPYIHVVTPKDPTIPPAIPIAHGYLKGFPNETQWFDLLDILGGITDLYKEPADLGGKAFQEYQLDQFINKGKSAVVVLVDYSGNSKDLQQRSLWHHSNLHLEGLSQLNTPPFHLQTLCRMMTDPEAVWNVVLKGHGDSIESLARRHQQGMFPLLLHRILWEKKHIESLEMDFIENLDLLTFCLAVSARRHNVLEKSDKMVIYYSGKPITNEKVISKTQEAIGAGKPYRVNEIEHIDCNPWPEGSKCCEVFYQHNNLTKGRYGRQDDWLHFEHDIIKVEKAPKLEVCNQVAYYNLWNAVGREMTYYFDDTDLGLVPQGVKSYIPECTVEYRKEDHQKIETRSGKGSLDFEKTFWDKYSEVPSSYDLH